MNFATSAYLRKATSRAKSDVANKLISMLLHDLSKRISSALGVSVTDAVYANAVADTFGSDCCYCFRPLEKDRVSVEHLQGMNRFRLGLHIPGNVIVSCRTCNGEKRRDDQLPRLTLAATGWESFLFHDSTRCEPTCKTCEYWKTVWPNSDERVERMIKARARIAAFRAAYREPLGLGAEAATLLQHRTDVIYRQCQEFATAQIQMTVDEIFSSLTKSKGQQSELSVGVGTTS